MGASEEFCGSLFKFFLGLINIVFFVLGLVIFIMAALLKWSGLLNKFINIKGIDTIVNLGSIGSISLALLIVGGFIIILSFLGLYGALREKKYMLKIYVVIVFILFLAMAVSLLVLVFSSSKIENEYRKALNATVVRLNTEKKDLDCDIMKGLSTIFHCCGANGPDDFKNGTLQQDCCDVGEKNTTSKVGCTEKSITDIKKNAIHYLVVPSSIILGVELFVMITVPYFIRKLNNKQRKRSY